MLKGVQAILPCSSPPPHSLTSLMRCHHGNTSRPPSSFLPRPRRKLCRARERVHQRALLWPDIPDAPSCHLPSSGEGRGGKTDFVLLCRSYPRRCCRRPRPAERTPPPSPPPSRLPAEAYGGSQSRRDVLSFARCDLPGHTGGLGTKAPAAAVHFTVAASFSGWTRSPNWADCERL